MKNKLLRTLLRRDCRWAAWLLPDRCLPGEQDDTLPSRSAVIWLTRDVEQDKVERLWSEHDRAGVVPAVETSLYRITLQRWFGKPVILWRTAVCVQVWVGEVVSLLRDYAFADEQAARRDFVVHGPELRKTLVGSSRYPHELKEADGLVSDIGPNTSTGSAEAVTSSRQPNPHGDTSSGEDQAPRNSAADRRAGYNIASTTSDATTIRCELSWLKRATQALADHHGVRLGPINDEALCADHGGRRS